MNEYNPFISSSSSTVAPGQHRRRASFAGAIPTLPSDSFDWNMILEMNTQLIQQNEDVESMSKIISNFLLCKFSQFDFQIIRVPIVFKLLQLLQVILSYQLNSQRLLKSKYKNACKENSSLHSSIDSLQQQNTKLKIYSKKCQKIEKCPTCQAKFDSIAKLDQHYHKFHPHLSQSWQCIREDKPDEILAQKGDELQNEILDLKQMIIRQNNNSIIPVSIEELKKPETEFHIPPQDKPKLTFSDNIEVINTRPYTLITLDNKSVSIQPQKIDDLYDVPQSVKERAKNFLNPRNRHIYQPENLDQIATRISDMVTTQSNEVRSKYNEHKKAYVKKIEEEFPKPEKVVNLKIEKTDSAYYRKASGSSLSESGHHPRPQIDRFSEAEYYSYPDKEKKIVKEEFEEEEDE